MTLPISDDFISQIHDFAENLMTPADIATLLDFTSEQKEEFDYLLRNEPTHPLCKAFFKGRAETTFALHQTTIQLAMKGSPAAQPIADEYLRHQLK